MSSFVLRRDFSIKNEVVRHKRSGFCRRFNLVISMMIDDRRRIEAQGSSHMSVCTMSMRPVLDIGESNPSCAVLDEFSYGPFV